MSRSSGTASIDRPVLPAGRLPASVTAWWTIGATAATRATLVVRASAASSTVSAEVVDASGRSRRLLSSERASVSVLRDEALGLVHVEAAGALSVTVSWPNGVGSGERGRPLYAWSPLVQRAGAAGGRYELGGVTLDGD